MHIFFNISKAIRQFVRLFMFCKSCEPEIVLAVLQIKNNVTFVKPCKMIKQTVALLWKF